MSKSGLAGDKVKTFQWWKLNDRPPCEEKKRRRVSLRVRGNWEGVGVGTNFALGGQVCLSFDDVLVSDVRDYFCRCIDRVLVN